MYDNVTGDETDSDRTELEENCDSDISYGTTTTVEAKRKFGNSDRTENYNSDNSYGKNNLTNIICHNWLPHVWYLPLLKKAPH